MGEVAVVVELELVFLDASAVHYAHQYPWTYVKSCHFYIDFAFGFSSLGESWPVHLVVSCFDDSIRDPEKMFVGISS